jgi:hypothetical protein
MTRITPCLWYDGTAEEAANLYASIFPDSSVDGQADPAFELQRRSRVARVDRGGRLGASGDREAAGQHRPAAPDRRSRSI